jgi:hypothetical protein
MEDKRINPEIKEIQIGIRELRTVKIYPLSFRDQSKASDIITEALNRFLAGQNQADIVFVKSMLDLLTERADQILSLVMDESEKGQDVLAELTNKQLLKIGEAIYEVNFEGIIKKAQGLFGMLMQVSESLPERPSLDLSGASRSTESPTSTVNPSGKAE